jgi:hypothetical protein
MGGDTHEVTMPAARTYLAPALLAAADRAAAHTGQTRSELLRDALARELRDRGFWPPRATDDVQPRGSDAP